MHNCLQNSKVLLLQPAPPGQQCHGAFSLKFDLQVVLPFPAFNYQPGAEVEQCNYAEEIKHITGIDHTPAHADVMVIKTQRLDQSIVVSKYAALRNKLESNITNEA